MNRVTVHDIYINFVQTWSHDGLTAQQRSLVCIGNALLYHSEKDRELPQKIIPTPNTPPSSLLKGSRHSPLQLVPVQPGSQVQTYKSSPSSIHSPFSHGLGEHKSMVTVNTTTIDNHDEIK